MPRLMFSSTPIQRDENWNKHDDTSSVPRVCLDDFYASVTDFTITDQEALDYMNFATKGLMKDAMQERLGLRGKRKDGFATRTTPDIRATAVME